MLGFALEEEQIPEPIGDLNGQSETLAFSISSVQKKGCLFALLVIPSPTLKIESSSFLL